MNFTSLILLYLVMLLTKYFNVSIKQKVNEDVLLLTFSYAALDSLSEVNVGVGGT